MSKAGGEFAVVTRRKANNKGVPLAVKKPDAQVESETARLIRFMFSYNPKGKRKHVTINGRQSPPWAYASDAFPSNLIEFVYHPDVYKTRMCPDGEKCREPREKCGYLHPHEVFLPPWRCQGLVVDGYWYPPDPVTYEWFRYLMLEFKTSEHPCRIKRDHDIQRCPYWHLQADPSDHRDPVLLNPETGRWIPLPNNSPLTAVRFHPMSYKRQACIFIEGQREKCIRGRYCTHSHLGDEIVLIPRYLERLKQELLKPMGNPVSKIMPMADSFASDGYPSPPLSSVSSVAHSPPLSPRLYALPHVSNAGQPVVAMDMTQENTMTSNMVKNGRAPPLAAAAEMQSPKKEKKDDPPAQTTAGAADAGLAHWGAVTETGLRTDADPFISRSDQLERVVESMAMAVVAGDMKDNVAPPAAPMAMSSRFGMGTELVVGANTDQCAPKPSMPSMQLGQGELNGSVVMQQQQMDQLYNNQYSLTQGLASNQQVNHCFSYGLNSGLGQIFPTTQWRNDWDSQQSMFSAQPLHTGKGTQGPTSLLPNGEARGSGDVTWPPHNPWSAFASPMWASPQSTQFSGASSFSAPLSANKYKSWTADDVMRWALGHPDPTIQAAAPILRANDIDGSLLMSLDDHSLRDMGMLSFGMRAKTMAAISKVSGAAL